MSCKIHEVVYSGGGKQYKMKWSGNMIKWLRSNWQMIIITMLIVGLAQVLGLAGVLILWGSVYFIDWIYKKYYKASN